MSSPRYRFIAGGIGITPILPMIAEAEAAGAEWTLLYGGRERNSMAFVDELAGYGDKVTIAPQDETGMLDLASVLSTPEPDTLVYCCGPEGLLAAVEKLCESAGRRRAARPHGVPAGAIGGRAGGAVGIGGLTRLVGQQCPKTGTNRVDTATRT